MCAATVGSRLCAQIRVDLGVCMCAGDCAHLGGDADANLLPCMCGC